MTATPSIETRGRGMQRQQLPEEVAAYVRELIISGTVRAGEHLRMEPIAAAVGVSNTPVREGLLMLRSEGFIRLVPRRGFIVEPFTRQDVTDLFWAQAQLAGELASRAATSISEEGIAEIEQLLPRYDRAIEQNDAASITALGHEFHRLINIAADSQRLALLLGSVVRHLPNVFYATIEGQVAHTATDHPMIADAIRRRDPRAARAAMEQHILSGGDKLIGTLAHRGLWNEGVRGTA